MLSNSGQSLRHQNEPHHFLPRVTNLILYLTMEQRLLDSLPTVISFRDHFWWEFSPPSSLAEESTDMDPYCTVTMETPLCSFRSVDDMTFRLSHIYKNHLALGVCQCWTFLSDSLKTHLKGWESGQMIITEAWGQIPSIHEKAAMVGHTCGSSFGRQKLKNSRASLLLV